MTVLNSLLLLLLWLEYWLIVWLVVKLSLVAISEFDGHIIKNLLHLLNSTYLIYITTDALN